MATNNTATKTTYDPRTEDIASEFDIRNFLSKVVRPLYKNRYVAHIFVPGIKELSDSATANQSSIGEPLPEFKLDHVLIDSFSIPAQDITQTDLDWGGHTIGVASKWVPNELVMTVINNGNTYAKFLEFINDRVYNQKEKAFRYFDEMSATIKITEFYNFLDGKKMKPAYTLQFDNCILKGLSEIELSMAPAEDIEKFRVTYSIGYMRVSNTYNEESSSTTK